MARTHSFLRDMSHRKGNNMTNVNISPNLHKIKDMVDQNGNVVSLTGKSFIQAKQELKNKPPKKEKEDE